jgi:thiol-disulfide isomerase/thioredoxin
MKRALLSLLLLTSIVATADAQLPAGSKAPTLSAKEWFNLPAGFDVADLRGRVVFVEFWATW